MATKLRKDAFVILRLTDDMRDEFSSLAYKAGITNSEAARQAIAMWIAAQTQAQEK